MSYLEVMCIDCEEQWNPVYEVPHCICEEPEDFSWILYARDKQGTWVKVMMDAMDEKYYKEFQ